MKKILAIFQKDTKIRFSTPWEWLFFLILPVFFTFILAGGTTGSVDSRVRMVVVDQAVSPFSDWLIDELNKSDTLRVELLGMAQAEIRFEKLEVSSLLVIPADFMQDGLQDGHLSVELRQQPNNLDSLAAYQAVQAAVNRISDTLGVAEQSTSIAEDLQPFASAADRQVYYEESLQTARDVINGAPDRFTVTLGETVDEIDYDPRANSSAGQMITWVFIPLFGISSLFAYEREKGTLRRILVSPTSRATFLLGTIITAVIWALVQMLLLILFGIFAMKLPWGQSPLALALVLTSSALAAAAIGVAMGAFIKSEGQAQGLSIMLGMVMGLLGGCWYPIELFPAVVQQAVKILPTRWAMEGTLDIVLRQQGLREVLPEAGVLLGFALVFLIIGIVGLNYRGGMEVK